MRHSTSETGLSAQSEISTAAACRDAVRLLDEALQSPPGSLNEEVDQAERRVVRLRNLLIERLRRDEDDPSYWRRPLDRANVALSLIAAVEYPATGIHLQYMEDALKVLKDMQEILPE